MPSIVVTQGLLLWRSHKIYKIEGKARTFSFRGIQEKMLSVCAASSYSIATWQNHAEASPSHIFSLDNWQDQEETSIHSLLVMSYRHVTSKPWALQQHPTDIHGPWTCKEDLNTWMAGQCFSSSSHKIRQLDSVRLNCPTFIRQFERLEMDDLEGEYLGSTKVGIWQVTQLGRVRSGSSSDLPWFLLFLPSLEA